MTSPSANSQIDRGNSGLNERHSKMESLEASPTYAQGGLVTAAADHVDTTITSKMGSGGYGNVGLKEKYHPLRTGEPAKIDLLAEREKDITPEILTAELRINEPHHT
ncbi:hypothetical protein BGZ49_003443 [Haplosporangium sp. Z 27]|nr:hypothetical protein BGZ49_003443 [Haplosporangium sp. Z 27]